MKSCKKLLAVIDMQEDFIGGALGTAEAKSVLPRVRERIARARREGYSVAFTRDTHGQDYLSTREGKNLPVPHCIAGTAGWQLAEGLAKEGDMIFDKPTFGSAALAEYAAAEGFGKIELVGVCTDICVISNALLLKAYLPEAEISVRADCCAGVTPESHARALGAMAACQVGILR